MRELVGTCTSCGKDVYCQDGFLNGVVLDNGRLHCFDCEQKPAEESAEQTE